ncbi:malate synthase A [soil metagenome]
MNSAVPKRELTTGVRCFNTAPTDFHPETHLPKGFMEFLLPLHRELTPRQQALIDKRAEVLTTSHQGRKPEYLPLSEATAGVWKIQLPGWCADQRNQMTGPADDAELVVKMLNSGAPGVMLDLEDSMANFWLNLKLGIDNIVSALKGDLTYFDAKRNRTVGIDVSKTVVFTRSRGLHLSQAGILPQELMSASLFDVALVAYRADLDALQHPIAFYIPKSESAEEALWWRDLFQAIEDARSWPRGSIKCMALVESHPIAYQMEEFIYHLRDHIVGLNLGRWDYMASLIHFNLEDPEWVLPDRNTIPHDVPFFQNLRGLLADTCHKRGILAIGGMTALYPSRADSELNERALRVLAVDKKNEATCLMDGAWTGHPDQNEIAVKQFPFPNQLDRRRPIAVPHADLRPIPKSVGKMTLEGTRAAVRTVIRYRNGVLNGQGASLLDGYMEDLATDRIYRLMIAQRIRHRASVDATNSQGIAVRHTPEFVSELFDRELDRILAEVPAGANGSEVQKFPEARRISELLITNGEIDPI